MRRFKANNAKEKISMLREKYSKNVHFKHDSDSSSDSLSLENNETRIKLDPSSEKDPIYTPVCQVIEDTSTVKADSTLPGDILTEHKKDDILGVFENSFDTPLSPGSLVLSELSNQFERIRFISSSSEDTSIVQTISSKSQSTPIKSILSIKFSEPDEKSVNNNEKSEKTYEHDEQIFVGNQRRALSLTDSEIDSTMSSIKEINYVSDAGHNSDETNSNGNSCNVSNFDSTHIKNGIADKSGNIDIESDIDSNSSKCSEREKSTTKSNYIQIESHDTKTNTGNEFENLQVRSSSGILMNRSNKSTNTEPVQIIDKVPRQQTMLFVEKVKKNKLKNHIQTKQNLTQYLHKKSACKKSQMIKPCELIKLNRETSKDELNSLPQKSFFSLGCNLSEDIYYNRPIGNTDYVCDEVIRQLLKNQIQFTRHFIESHHQMYLQVYKAVQLLNKS